MAANTTRITGFFIKPRYLPAMMTLILPVLLLAALTPVAAAAAPSFHELLTCEAGDVPTNIIAEDFNRDGIVDLALAKYVNTSSYPGYVTILLGNGTGSFTKTKEYKVRNYPYSVTAADFDNNGITDLAVANRTSDSVSILLGIDGDNFQVAKSYPTDKAPHCVVAADFNGDGWTDLAVANFSSNSITILQGIGNGNFAEAANYSDDKIGKSPACLAAEDFDRDGNIDLAVVNQTSVGDIHIRILLGNGDTSFRDPQYYNGANNPSSLTCGDFNGDGLIDLAVAGYYDGSGKISILVGKGDGSFQAYADYDIGNNPRSIITADFNCDGVADLAVANYDSNTVSILTGNGDGSFEKAIDYNVGAKPLSVAAADFNGDGKVDLATANSASGDVSLLLNSTTFPGQLQFSQASYSVAEDAHSATITVTRTDGSDSVVTVVYRTADGTASAGLDYETASGSLTFNDGETTSSFTVVILDDAEPEIDETVILSLSSPSGGAVLGSPATAVLTIIDNDVPDTRPPQIISSDPVDKATGIDINQAITIIFNEVVQPGSEIDAITLAGDNSTVAYTYSLNGKALVIKPLASLDYSSGYTLTIPAGAITDLAGNALATSFKLNFRTITAPEPDNNNSSSPGSNSSDSYTAPAPVAPAPPPPQLLLTVAQLQAAVTASDQISLYWAAKTSLLAAQLLEPLGVNIGDSTITANLTAGANTGGPSAWPRQMLAQSLSPGSLQKTAPDKVLPASWINNARATAIIQQVLEFAGFI
ncbi:MAG: hypothetical protein GX039_04250 [Clostridia bacterium]|nr:hypothetical protein [Clostridia bacterium]